MTKISEEELHTMTIKQLVAVYNEHSVNKIKKFVDKPTAIARVLKILRSDQPIIILEPSEYGVLPCREDTKIAKIIDALWTGATETEILKILGETKKTKANRAKFNHWLRWNVNKDKGYGIAKKHEDGNDKFFAISIDGAKKLPHISKADKEE